MCCACLANVDSATCTDDTRPQPLIQPDAAPTMAEEQGRMTLVASWRTKTTDTRRRATQDNHLRAHSRIPR